MSPPSNWASSFPRYDSGFDILRAGHLTDVLQRCLQRHRVGERGLLRQDDESEDEGEVVDGDQGLGILQVDQSKPVSQMANRKRASTQLL